MNTRIKQQQIEHLLVLREQVQEARTLSQKLLTELEGEEERLMAALQSGTPVEPGRYFLLIATEPKGRSVAWRRIVEENLGRSFAEKVLADTAPGEEQVLKVVQEVKTVNTNGS